MERLHKYLAHCGIASRRKAEELISEGRVRVNGETVISMGIKIDPAGDRVQVDGKPVRPQEKTYLLMHKPRNLVTTSSDELGRRTVLDLLPDLGKRVYPVGRLDRESEGLLVLTNDGALANYLTHPACGVKKTYRVTIRGQVEAETLAKLVSEGMQLGPLRVQPLACHQVRSAGGNSVLEVVVGEGINREVRRLFAGLGHEVKRLVRVRIGPLLLKGLGKGKVRQLRPEELASLKKGMRAAGASEGSAAGEPARNAAASELRPDRLRTRYFRKRGERIGKPDPARKPERKHKGRPQPRARPQQEGAKKNGNPRPPRRAPGARAAAHPLNPKRTRGKRP